MIQSLCDMGNFFEFINKPGARPDWYPRAPVSINETRPQQDVPNGTYAYSTNSLKSDKIREREKRSRTVRVLKGN